MTSHTGCWRRGRNSTIITVGQWVTQAQWKFCTGPINRPNQSDYTVFLEMQGSSDIIVVTVPMKVFPNDHAAKSCAAYAERWLTNVNQCCCIYGRTHTGVLERWRGSIRMVTKRGVAYRLMAVTLYSFFQDCRQIHAATSERDHDQMVGRLSCKPIDTDQYLW